MKMLKKIKTDMWISVVMMFLIGVLFVVRPQDSLEITAIIAGVIIFVNGIYDLVYYKRHGLTYTREELCLREL